MSPWVGRGPSTRLVISVDVEINDLGLLQKGKGTEEGTKEGRDRLFKRVG